MFHFWISDTYDSLLALAGIIFAFAATVFATHKLQGVLPKDAGREFAHDGKLSAGKPRGAGIIFVLCFVAASLLFAPLDAEIVIYLILTVICMMTGFLDDASKMPWGEYKKGFLDLCVAALVAMTFLKYNSNTIELALFHVSITIPPVLFAILIGWQIIGKEYNPSAQERYYRDIMLQLEGELTDEKEALIISEQEKYDKAFSEIERIDNMTANGKISENAADGLKAELYAVTFFYPAFERVQHQYQRICENGGSFIYDTGYLYLFGLKNNDQLINLFLLSLCVVTAFGNVIPMEYQCGVWYLLGATKAGKKKIIYRKAAVCIMAVMGLSIIPVICRFINISTTYPMPGAGVAITDIPYFEQLPQALSIRAFIILLILAQMGALIAVAAGTLVISYWRKNHIQSVFFSILVFVVPLILKISGIGFAGWFSVYPLYSWTTLIGA